MSDNPFRFTTLPLDTVPADLTGADGYIKLLSSVALDALPAASVRLWAHLNGRYHLPTAGTIGWLNIFIAGRRAIEIGSGTGDLAHYLGIPATDNKMQTWPAVASFYAALNHPTLRYGPDVEELGAAAAIRKHQPQIVIGAWVTHWIDPNQPMPPGGGNVHGIREDEIVGAGLVYVMIGNKVTHQHKPILKLPHREIALPFLRSRGDPAEDRVFIWNG